MSLSKDTHNTHVGWDKGLNKVKYNENKKSTLVAI
jgi:hypothetical protein